MVPQNNRDHNQVVLHLWSKFGDPSLNRSRVIAWTIKWLTHRLTHTHTHTDPGNDITWRPKLASGKNECSPIVLFFMLLWCHHFLCIYSMAPNVNAVKSTRRCIKSRNSNVSRLVWQLLLPHPLKPDVNPLHAKFFRGNINIYLHFVSFLHIDTTQVSK